jgi:hypothetical protein
MHLSIIKKSCSLSWSTSWSIAGTHWILLHHGRLKASLCFRMTTTVANHSTKVWMSLAAPTESARRSLPSSQVRVSSVSMVGKILLVKSDNALTTLFLWYLRNMTDHSCVFASNHSAPHTRTCLFRRLSLLSSSSFSFRLMSHTSSKGNKFPHNDRMVRFCCWSCRAVGRTECQWFKMMSVCLTYGYENKTIIKTTMEWDTVNN